MVTEFHKAVGHPIADAPTLDDPDENYLRHDLIREELSEFKEACQERDLVAAFDALCDLEYVVQTAFIALGFHRLKAPGMAEVHRSNMSKANADGEFRRDPITGKILKGDNYSPPNLAKIMEQS